MREAMDGMDNSHDHMHGMNGTSGMMMHGNMHHKMMMHMTFYWGKDGEILFDKWPGTSTGMYVLALIFVFVLAFLIELISHCRFIKPGSNHAVAGLIQTVLHAFRVGLAYLVMLAVMSFNVGVFLVAVVGHTLGFLVFGSSLFKTSDSRKTSDLPPMNC